MGLGVQGAIRMALCRDMGNGIFYFFHGNPPFCPVGSGQLCEHTGGRHVGPDHKGIDAPSGTPWQTTVPCIFQFFQAHGQNDVIYPGSYGVARGPEGLCGRGTIILCPRNRDIGQLQG